MAGIGDIDPFSKTKAPAKPTGIASIDPFKTGYEAPTMAGDFKKGISSGIDSLQGALYGLAGIAGDKYGVDAVRDFGLEGFKRNQEEAAANAPAVQRIEDVDSAKSLGLYAAGGIGQLVPYLATSVASGGIGGAVGGIAARKTAEIAGRKAIESGVGKATVDAATRAATREGVSRGAMTGSIASSVPVEQGSIYGNIYEETGKTDADTALGYGLAAGLLDAVPEIGLISKLAKPGGKSVRIGREVAKQAGAEAATEAGQTIIERSAVNAVDPNYQVFSPEGVSEILNASALGLLGGGVVGGAGAVYSKFANGKAVADQSPEDNNAPQLPPAPEAAEPASPFLLEDKRAFVVAPNGSTFKSQADFDATWKAADIAQRATLLGMGEAPAPASVPASPPATAMPRDDAGDAIVDRMTSNARDEMSLMRFQSMGPAPQSSADAVSDSAVANRLAEAAISEQGPANDPRDIAAMTEEMVRRGPKLRDTGPLSRAVNTGIESGATSLMAPPVPQLTGSALPYKGGRAPITFDEAGKVISIAPEHQAWLSQASNPSDAAHGRLALQAHAINPQLVEAALAAPDISSADERAIFQRIVTGQGLKNEKLDQRIQQLALDLEQQASSQAGGSTQKPVDSQRTAQRGNGGGADAAGPAAKPAEQRPVAKAPRKPKAPTKRVSDKAKDWDFKDSYPTPRVAEREAGGRSSIFSGIPAGKLAAAVDETHEETLASLQGNFLQARIIADSIAKGTDPANDKPANEKRLQQLKEELAQARDAIESTLSEYEAEFGPEARKAFQQFSVPDFVPNDRRNDFAQRKRTSEMSADEMRTALLTDDLTGLPNRRAFNEAERLPVQTRVDLDGFKAINDRFGHDAGDEVLRVMARVLDKNKGEGRVFRIGGDEFPGEFSTAAQAKKAMEAVRADLAKVEFTFALPDGSKQVITGVGFSYGIGKDSDAAEAALIADKAERKQAGLRRTRDDDAPAGNAETSEGKQAGVGETARQVARKEPTQPSPVTPSPEGVSVAATGKERAAALATVRPLLDEGKWVEAHAAAIRAGKPLRFGAQSRTVQPAPNVFTHATDFTEAGHDFFIGRGHGDVSENWRVIHKGTGLSVSSQKTSVAAREEATRRLEQFKDKMEEAINRAGLRPQEELEREWLAWAKGETSQDDGTTVSDLAGDKINREWTAFAKDSGTLNIPRSEMPQIKAEHRGAMVNFLNARGIAHEQEDVSANTLKPTQAEFSPAKVAKAKKFEGGDRSILVSRDNHVLDGHHQWLAKLDNNQLIQVIRLDAPIRELLKVVAEFPSAETASGATAPAPDKTQEAQAKKPTDKIDDFGEKILGARKDLMAAYAERMAFAETVDTREAPLSQSWPEPDYQALIDAGADPKAVALARALRDDVATKPKATWKLAGWSGRMETLRKIAKDVLAGEAGAKAPDDAIRGRAELYEEMGHAASLRGVTFKQHHYSYYKGENNVRKWVIERKAKATSFSNWPTELGVGNTREEALEAFRAVLAKESQTTTVKTPTEFVLYTRPSQRGKVFIGKKVGSNHVDLKTFDSVEEARAFKDSNQEALEALWAKRKIIPPERRPENSPRVGVDHRAGADVTTEQFSETFGFRGVQFGNYVEGARRQADLNQAYDALMDLAGVQRLLQALLRQSG